MNILLWVLVASLSDLSITCMLLRLLPVKQERWIPAIPLPVMVITALILRFAVQVSWEGSLAICAGFLWGVMITLASFRGWVSSWTLPVHGTARMRLHEVALVILCAVAPLETKTTAAAMEKAFAVRPVRRGRGPFPLLMGSMLLVLPTVCAMGAGWATRTLG